MTPKERLLNAIVGKPADRLSWSPNLAYYWEYLPKSIRDKGKLAYLQEMGADPLMRGSHILYDFERKNCKTIVKTVGKERFESIETPVGNICAKRVYKQEGNTWFLTEHPIKTKDDFKTLTYYFEDAKVVPTLEQFEIDYKKIGNEALLVPLLGAGHQKSAFQSMAEYWVGTEQLVYALVDYPDVVQECLDVMQQRSIEAAKIAAGSSAEVFIFWEDSSTTNFGPDYVEKYATPEINAWGDCLGKAGKYLIHHACGHIKGLLETMGKSKIDMIESISPPPTGNIELWDAREMLPSRIGLIGGIEPTVFLNSSMQELRDYVENLINRMDGSRFILANSDSCPPGVCYEKFKMITELIKR